MTVLNKQYLTPPIEEAEIDEMLEQESSGEDECSFSDGEIWNDNPDVSDDEIYQSESSEAEKVVLGMCLFPIFSSSFTKYQRPILALLLFLRTLLSLIGLHETVSLLPKSLESIKSPLRNTVQQQNIVEYVVCP